MEGSWPNKFVQSPVDDSDEVKITFFAFHISELSNFPDAEQYSNWNAYMNDNVQSIDGAANSTDE